MRFGPAKTTNLNQQKAKRSFESHEQFLVLGFQPAFTPATFPHERHAATRNLTALLTSVYLAILLILILAPSAGAATSADPPSDPRICRGYSQVDCARSAAIMALRRAIAVHDHLPYPVSQGQRPTCIAATRNWLNFRCTFWHHSVQDRALVWLGKAPTWKPVVRFLT